MSKKSTIECCVFCYGQENGKPVSLCSTCVQKLLLASPEEITAMKQADNVTTDQLYFLESLTEEEEVQYDFKTRKYRKDMERKRTGRTAKPAHSGVRQMRAA